MKITFVVDKICNIMQNEWTDKVSDFVCTTPGCVAANNDNHGWRYLNKELIRDFVNLGYINLKTVDNFINTSYSFYVINISSAEHLIDQTFWDFMDSKTINFLKTTNIPIMLFYPLEGTGYLDKSVYVNIIKKRNNYGLKNKFILLSLCYYNDHHFNKFNFAELDPLLEDFKWVVSTCFLIRYVGKSTHTDSTIEHWKKDKKIVPDHDYNNKKYDFLCLNNAPTLNRILLLKLLYSNEKLWNNNLISNRFIDFNDNHGTVIQLLHLTKKEKEYFKDDSIKKSIEDNIYFFNFSQTELGKFLKKLSDSDLAPVKVIENDGPAYNDGFNSDWYRDSVFTLITETYAWTQNFYTNYTMFTEKTTKSIIQRHPFIIFSYANNHKLCNLFGFKTFETLFNIPKDGELGNLTTLERLYHIYNMLCNFDREKLDIQMIKNYTEYNYNHLISTDWYNVQCNYMLDIFRESNLQVQETL